MITDNTFRIDKSAFLLLPIMALAFYIAFLPHQDYPYLVHIDEWVHLARSEAMLMSGSFSHPEPFFGESTVVVGSSLEAGFHLFWGVFQRISGISSLDIYRYFPGVIFMFTVLASYVLANRRGYGWEAALFTSLIPTTVGILGPAFLVPVASGLLFIPLSLFLAFYCRNIWGYLALFIFTCFLLVIHAPSAICLVLILLPYIILNLKGNFKHALGMILAVILPFLVPFPWIFGMLLPTARQLLTPQVLPEYVDFPRFLKTYGYLPTGLCLLGVFVLAFKGGKRNYGLVLGLLVILAMLVTFFTFHYGISIMYERGLMFMILMIGIVAGAGLMLIKTMPLPEWLSSKMKIGGYSIPRYLGWSLCLVLIGITLFISIPDRQDTPYYHMIDDEDYQTFIWIKENVGEAYDKAVLDPWKATAFTALTGKHIYTRIHAFPKPSDEEARVFLEEGCSDSAFLKRNGISLVYTREACDNPDLVQVGEWVYLLKE